MSKHLFGWDLPPGCNVSDIPGNRSEDEAWDKILDDFYVKLGGIEERLQAMLDTNQSMYEVIEHAITYGIELGKLDQGR